MIEDLNMEELNIAREAFKEEARERVAELESALLELETSKDKKDAVERIFRALHTIKGSGAMFGFDAVTKITHEAETVYDMVRKNKIEITKELVDITLPVVDQIMAIIEETIAGSPIDNVLVDKIVSSFKRFTSKTVDTTSSTVSSTEGNAPALETQGKEVTYRIRFRPSHDILIKDIDPKLLFEDLSHLGRFKVFAHTDCIPEIDNIEPEKCYTHWDIILTTPYGMNAINDVFIFVEDKSELKIDVIFDSDSINEGIYKKVGEILVERGDIKEEDLQKVLSKKKLIGEMLIENGLVDSSRVESALIEQEHLKDALISRQKMEIAASVRVPLEKLDRLVNLVGEMVTLQARLSQTVSLRNDPELMLISEEGGRLTEELRENTMNIRMLPIRTIFSKFRRFVRDLSVELGKDVSLVTEGGETELDKTVIEKLNDPLVHLIRNSIDHGIELPDIREAAGKSRQGIIRLSAMHTGPEVLIKIEDDGAGLDIDAIHSKAVKNGLISENDTLNEKELYSLIFMSGFSTAMNVTNVSGRGVGLDVVKKVIESLRGSIEMDSKRGAGTVITLKLPLTLMIIDGLLVKVGEEDFVIPLSAVEECIELTKKDIEKGHGKHLVNIRGELVPYIRLRNEFRISGDFPEIEQVVISRGNNGRVGFVVDNVVGEQQTVIKSLGDFYKDIKGISGATILGNGKVALIMDVNDLAKIAEEDKMINLNLNPLERNKL
ncbi:MAG: chemotaxis protein CheA [Nitrospirota bacterium]